MVRRASDFSLYLFFLTFYFYIFFFSPCNFLSLSLSLYSLSVKMRRSPAARDWWRYRFTGRNIIPNITDILFSLRVDVIYLFVTSQKYQVLDFSWRHVSKRIKIILRSSSHLTENSFCNPTLENLRRWFFKAWGFFFILVTYKWRVLQLIGIRVPHCSGHFPTILYPPVNPSLHVLSFGIWWVLEVALALYPNVTPVDQRMQVRDMTRRITALWSMKSSARTSRYDFYSE